MTDTPLSADLGKNTTGQTVCDPPLGRQQKIRPTLENWDQPPFNRWSFQNVRSLIPTADVYRGSAPVAPLESVPQDLSDVTFDALDGTRKTLKQHLQETYSDGFLVLHRDRVVSESYFNDMRAETPHLTQSLSKSLVGVLAGILHGAGLFDLEQPLADLVPDLSGSGYGDATFSQVLDMQSGVRFNEDYSDPHSDMARLDVASGWRPHRLGGTPATIRDIILSLPKVRPHGEIFEYRSIESDVVAWVLERVTGLPLAEITSRYLWQALGAERDAYFTVDAAGTALADGGFNATLRDLARLGRLLLRGGHIGEQQLLPEAWARSLSSGDGSKFGDPYSLLSPRGAYRRQWWVHDLERGDYMARGVFGQLIYIDPRSDLLAVKLSTWPDYLVPAFVADSLRAIAAIRDALTLGDAGGKRARNG